MDTQNVTVTLPTDLVREARHMAVDNGMSLSRFVASIIQERVESTRRYQAAWERQKQMLDEGLPIGTHDQITWSRDELHRR